MSKHWKYGGSTAARTVKCPAWAGLSEGIPRSPASQAAADGTTMHAMFEKGIKDTEYIPENDLGLKVEGVEVTQAMVDKVNLALDTQFEFEFASECVNVNAEMQFQITPIIGGTADIVMWSKTSNIFCVGDLKTGDGQMVYADNNEQLLFYAYIAIRNLHDQFPFNDKTTIVLYIIQPSDRREEPLDVWETDLKTVLDFGIKMESQVIIAESGDAPPISGRHCKFCPAEAVCPAKTGVTASAMRLDAANAVTLNDAMQIVDEVENWTKAVRKMAHEQASQGVKIKGWKLVAKRATRVWNDLSGIEMKLTNMRKLLKKEFLEQKLMSPAKIEQLCKRKDVDFKQFEAYISKHSSGTTLAHESDKRPEQLPVAGLAAMVANIK